MKTLSPVLSFSLLSVEDTRRVEFLHNRFPGRQFHYQPTLPPICGSNGSSREFKNKNESCQNIVTTRFAGVHSVKVFECSHTFSQHCCRYCCCCCCCYFVVVVVVVLIVVVVVLNVVVVALLVIGYVIFSCGNKLKGLY